MIKLSKTLAVTALSVAVAGGALAQQRTVYVYNWSDYIGETTLEDFTAKTGIEVVYDVFDSNDVLEAKILSGQTGYDVVVPTTNYMARQIQAGAYQKIDKSLLTNYDNLDMELMERLSNYDAGNEYGVPWQWGTNGIGYNVDKVEEILGESAPTDSWELVFNPRYASQLADCGITFLDSGNEMFPLMLQYMGRNPYSRSVADYRAAMNEFMKVRPYIQYFHNSRYIADLANGEVCVSVGWSGDVFQAVYRAEDAGADYAIDYYIPKEGTVLWADMMVIPRDARNVAEAHEFINFVLEPEAAAGITNYVWYGSPVEAANPYIDPEILNNPGIYPPEGTELFTNEVLPNSVMREITRSWTRVRTGS